MDVPVELRLEKAILRQNIVSPMDSSQRQSPSPLKQSLNGEPARAQLEVERTDCQHRSLSGHRASPQFTTT